MDRRSAALVLALLLALPVVAPVSASAPSAAPAPEASSGTSNTDPAVDPGGSVPASTEAAPADAGVPIDGPSPVGPAAPAAPAAPPAPPAAAEPAVGTPAPVAPSTDGPVTHGRPDATGRYIVMLRDGADTAAVVDKVRRHDAVHPDGTFAKAIKGFAAKLDARQKRDVAADPNVVAIVPDEVIQVTGQIVPTGVSRIGGQNKDVSLVNTAGAPSTTNVDADVAIVDTGIAAHPDLNIAGGYNCSTSDRSAWRDKNNHGTHVAGIVGAIDNGFGVVGVAPGARVWAVKILNDDGYGLISWYVCGLDWILAQKDPKDASRPLFEAVNMSVTKPGSDDRNCGNTNHDPLHRAVCRVVAGGITIVAAAANDHHDASLNIPASYEEVITVSALADTDGKPGGLGGNRCFSWGTYDKDDTFADFSNYGFDIDLIAPGKCIWSTIPGPSYAYMSGTSMAAPEVTGAVALYKASRPKATPAEVKEALRYLGNYNWATSTDPDRWHEPLLDVSRIFALGTFDITPTNDTPPNVEAPATRVVPITLDRTETFFERVQLSIASVPDGWTASVTPSTLFGWDAKNATVSFSVPAGTPPGTYQIGIQGTNQGRTVTGQIPVNVIIDLPTAVAPVAWVVPGIRAGTSSAQVNVSWPQATDPSSGIAGYEVQVRRGTGSWGGTIPRTASQRSAVYSVGYGVAYTFRVRARDGAGNWSDWAIATTPTVVSKVDDRSSSVTFHRSWARRSDIYALNGTYTSSSTTGAWARLYFTGRGVSLVARRSSSYGYVEVEIDGVVVRRVLLRSLPLGNRWIVFDQRFAQAGPHQIVVRVYSGTLRTIGIDGFLVTQ